MLNLFIAAMALISPALAVFGVIKLVDYLEWKKRKIANGGF